MDCRPAQKQTKSQELVNESPPRSDGILKTTAQYVSGMEDSRHRHQKQSLESVNEALVHATYRKLPAKDLSSLQGSRHRHHRKSQTCEWEPSIHRNGKLKTHGSSCEQRACKRSRDITTPHTSCPRTDVNIMAIAAWLCELSTPATDRVLAIY